MSVNALLSTVVLVAFIVTIVLAVGSYMAYKIRERRRAPATPVSTEGEPVFFERVFPGGSGGPRVAPRTIGDRPHGGA
jgi:hypothetical protein